jgi:hypothetical protein
MSDANAQATNHAATLRDWRARRLDQVDPVRFAFMEALVRRAAEQSDTARQLLEEKIARLMASYGEAVASVAEGAPMHAPAHVRPAVPTGPPSGRPHGPLGALAALINQRSAEQFAPAMPASSSARGAFPSDELKALSEVRNTWLRLAADKRLKQAVAQVPENAGPLNSYQLVLRTLLLMRDVSPEYLQRFMAHVDTLMWLERTAS